MNTLLFHAIHVITMTKNPRHQMSQNGQRFPGQIPAQSPLIKSPQCSKYGECPICRGTINAKCPANPCVVPGLGGGGGIYIDWFITIYTNHPVGNFMRKHFLTEHGFTEDEKGSKHNYPNSMKRLKKKSKKCITQTNGPYFTRHSKWNDAKHLIFQPVFPGFPC